MSYRRPLVKAAAAVTAALSGAYVLWACGPYFPNWILAGDQRALNAPQASFLDEVDSILPYDQSPFPATQSDLDPYRQTAAIDQADFKGYLADLDLPAHQRESLLDRYRQTREDMTRFAMTSRPRFSSGPAVPEEIPGEFQDYLRGALAYHEGRAKDAEAIWRKLLERPPAERRYRSTWAAYMLGRTLMEQDPGAARQWFRQTRELASQGFEDSLGLASESLGWEARTELDRGHFQEALHLYGQQFQSGDSTAGTSLRMTAAKALDQSREVLLPLARDAETRQILTAYVLSQVGWLDSNDGDPSQDRAVAWMRIVQEAGVRDLAGADRLAWAAYAAGDFAGAETWLQAAPAASPMARWIRAKLLMRAGRLKEAELLLAETHLPLGDASLFMSWSYEGAPVPVVSPLQVAGETGVVQLSRGKYVPAVDSFLRGAYWLDAAYLAERVLTAGELRAYVDRRWPAQLAARYNPEEGSAFNGGEEPMEEAEAAFLLRYLLGRRLAREGRYGEAAPYLPETLRPRLQEISAHLRTARDGGRPRQERAREMFQTACIFRHEGMELLGTEVEPDWHFFGGWHAPDFITEGRSGRNGKAPLPVTAAELARAQSSRVKPWARFHYRFRGADLAWEAASLLPDGSAEKARMLAVAGSWIKYLDPQAADRFYKRLVRCCGNTELGRLADERRWFPEVEDCNEVGKLTVKSP